MPHGSDDTPRFAVIGNPIAHSLSPLIHQRFAQQTGCLLHYEALEVLSQFDQHVIQFFNHGGKGLNITLPYKEHAYRLAAVKTARCEKAGAANTLWFEDQAIHADNTDGVGLLCDLNRNLNLLDKTIVLLGAGGAARGVIDALLSANPRQLIISNRSLDKAQILQQMFPQLIICPFKDLTGSYDLLINATSASLDQKHLPLPLSIFSSQPFCYDLAYGKEPTPFVQWARAQGCQTRDGLGMLVEQAAEAFYRWHGVKPDTAPLLMPGALQLSAVYTQCLSKG